MIQPEKWRKINDLFRRLADQPPSRWEEYLKAHCPGDSETINEVLSLLHSDRRAAHFLEAVVPENPPADPPPHPAGAMAGMMTGPYRLESCIGEGGMGIVFLAERDDDQFRKKVAVKILKGAYLGQDLRRRFLTERQILARLQHPNIAQLLDGGVMTDGSPYFVMEYVEGLPVDEYCDSRNLSVPERLTLFRQICAAVHYAHQNLVVHRDLKPGHILVSADGIPKLLDFGIAKLLEPPAEGAPPLTREGMRLLTPEYASPEQLRGGTVTTASDIYSLGVILYFLLSGRQPYHLNGKTAPEMESVVCEKDPPRPSQVCGGGKRHLFSPENRELSAERISRQRRSNPKNLKRLLSGDPDNIILKAMQKEPSRRYSSAAEFSEDIRRYLAGLPVTARQTTLIYRTAKFVKRHKTGVAAAVLVLISLLAGMGAALWQSSLASRQRDLAMEAANSMVFELAEGLSRMSGPTEDRLGLLTEAAGIYDKINRPEKDLSRAGPREAEARRMLARTYHLLGNNELALQQAREAEQIARRLFLKHPEEEKYRILLSASLNELGDALAAGGKETEGMACFREVIAKLGNPAPDSGQYPRADRLRYAAYLRLGDRLFYRSTLDSAEACYRQAFTVSARMLQADSGSAEFRTLHATSIERLADISYYSGKTEESCGRYDEALRLRRRASQEAPRDMQMLRALSISLQNAGWCREQQQNPKAAVALYNESVDIQQRLHFLDPSNTFYTTALMGGLGTLANALRQAGQKEEAARYYSRAVDIGNETAAAARGNARILKKTADISRLLGELYLAEGQYGEAQNRIDSARAIMTRLLEKDSLNTDYQRSLALALTAMGDTRQAAGRPAEAARCYRQAGELCAKTADTGKMSPDRQTEAWTRYKLAVSLSKLSRPREARQQLLQAMKILLDLKAQDRLSEDSEGMTIYLPAIEKALAGNIP